MPAVPVAAPAALVAAAVMAAAAAMAAAATPPAAAPRRVPCSELLSSCGGEDLGLGVLPALPLPLLSPAAELSLVGLPAAFGVRGNCDGHMRMSAWDIFICRQKITSKAAGEHVCACVCLWGRGRVSAASEGRGTHCSAVQASDVRQEAWRLLLAVKIALFMVMMLVLVMSYASLCTGWGEGEVRQPTTLNLTLFTLVPDLKRIPNRAYKHR